MLTHTELWFIRVDNSTRQSPLLQSCVVALSGNGADADFKRIRCMESRYLILLESGRSHRAAWGHHRLVGQPWNCRLNSGRWNRTRGGRRLTPKLRRRATIPNDLESEWILASVQDFE